MSLITYKYTARNPSTGKKVTGEVQADSEPTAAKLLSEQGLAPLSISAKSISSSGPLGALRNRIPTKDKILFSRQLATLINAGLPLVQSLRTVLEQTTNKAMQAVIAKLITDIEAGSSLTDSLKKHPNVFNNIFTSLVEAGEASGTLDRSLDRLAVQQEKDAEITSKVKGAMVYPIVVMFVMVAVVGFMVVGVLPQVEQLYDGMGGSAQLPIHTKALLAISDFVIRFWWIVLIVLVGAAVFINSWRKTKSGVATFDALKMRTPAIGQLFMKLYMARFTRTAATLISSGVPIIRVLEIASQSIGNSHVSKSINNAIEKVKGGKSLSDAIENDPNFMDLVPKMIRIGEQSGQIEEMMSKTADYFEKELDNQIKTVSTIIEPVLMITLGIIAIVIVSAILLPIYGLVGQNIIN